MKKILSFSVAAYNVQDYLEKLIHSIVRSRYSEMIEVLIINDGSNDQTAVMADRMQKQYPKIVRHISKENGGHGSTINTGIELASGKYFRALDGDDWVDTKALNHLLSKLVEVEADIIISDYWQFYENRKPVRVRFGNVPADDIFSLEEMLTMVERVPYHAVIYKTQLLQDHHIRLDEHCFYVDTEYVVYPFAYAETATYLPFPLYCYRLGREGQSVDFESRKKHIRDGRKVLRSLIKFYNNNSFTESVKKYVLNCVSGSYCWYVCALMLFSPGQKHLKRLIRFEKKSALYYPDIYFNTAKMFPLIRVVRRTNYMFYYIYPWYCRMRNIL